MSLDSISETIAHFIGTFELTTEQARLREQYEEFTALRRKIELEDLAEATAINVRADLKLDPGKYGPLPYKFMAPDNDGPFPPASGGPIPEPALFLDPVSGPDEIIPEGQLFTAEFQQTIVVPELVPELIGSAVTYTFQTLNLSDNDTIGQGDFRDAEVLMQEGYEALDVALSLHVISSPSFDIADYQSVEKLEQLAEQMKATVTVQVDGATVHQFHGEEAVGIIVNGERVEELPDWMELLPQHHQSEDDEESGQPDPYPKEWDQSEDDVFGEGHTVIAGGNLAINEVSITVGWVDAPIIAVGGASYDLTVVSQVAIVSDIDEGEPGAQSETKVIQSSQIAVEASEASWIEDNVAPPGQDPLVVISWISGDLYVTNFVKQVIDATDIDHIQTEVSASNSMYVLGDNDMFNVNNVVQLGSFYDVVMVGGNMVSVDIVQQTIVLIDDDVVTGPVQDEVEENLVMNQVSLTSTGEDTHEDITPNLASVLPIEEVNTDALEDALLNDPAFAGMEQLRVLKIEGDLIQANVIEQITLLQDQDDVHLNGGNGAAASVLGAGNALLNAASVSKIGVDSVVMAAEGEYSDVLLHQASLIDSPDEELGEEIANEAIAFLMEETNGPGESDLAPGHNKLTPSEAASLDDGMQSMLA
ncbi:hypothetical protein RUESEDTHA_01892 [Ruegeria sp. THAF57]|uniref:type I secretion protein n=1 Tax=Ruegeria sp. THAF57 TaxID=2744555 RepID=UPI0015DD5DE4|nr:type I secretion protein [Ruegeria sp. THAF57]CAD0185007.1 hypothetical protein RUESEDTHA_01892 [Ruegeria sp. THAF57]